VVELRWLRPNEVVKSGDYFDATNDDSAATLTLDSLHKGYTVAALRKKYNCDFYRFGRPLKSKVVAKTTHNKRIKQGPKRSHAKHTS